MVSRALKAATLHLCSTAHALCLNEKGNCRLAVEMFVYVKLKLWELKGTKGALTLTLSLHIFIDSVRLT